MSTINNVDQALAQRLGGAQVLSSHDKSSEDSATASVQDVVYLASKVGPRKIANIYDTVRFSELVPKPLEAKFLEEADEMAERLRNKEILKAAEEDNLREDKIFNALVGMRLMQKNSGEVKEIWFGGLNKPTDKEIAEAYKRLTQRVSMPSEVDDPDYVHQMRIDLLDCYRDYPQNMENNDIEIQGELESEAA